VTTFVVESTNRWDALALVRKLARYRWYMFEPDASHWDVCIRVDHPPTPEPPEDLRRTVDAWTRERRLGPVVIRADT
jgi:hypothetical protein